MASIEFQNYFFDKISYSSNEKFDSSRDEGLDVSVHFSSTIAIYSENALINLNVELGDPDNIDCPFLVEVSLKGLFNYSYDPDLPEDKERAKELISNNGVAILYPYIRNIVSDLTVKSNQFPAYILPVINIIQILKEEDSIEIIDFDEINE